MKSDDGVGGREGAFSMVSFWLIEALTRAAGTVIPHPSMLILHTSRIFPSPTQIDLAAAGYVMGDQLLTARYSVREEILAHGRHLLREHAQLLKPSLYVQ